MVKRKNAEPTLKIRISTHPKVGPLLDQLVTRGLYGKNRSEVAEEHLRLKLRELQGNKELPREGELSPGS